MVELERPYKRVQVDCGKDNSSQGGRTVQASIDSCDINSMMKTYQRQGQIPPGTKTPQYGDFSNVPDYLDAKLLVKEANDQFDRLPAGIRKRFGNNPAELLEFMGDIANQEEAEELGLVEKLVPDPVTPEEPPAPEA